MQAKLSAGRFCDFAKWYPDFSTTNKRIEIRELIETKRQSLLDSTAVDIDPVDFGKFCPSRIFWF
jgi:hypothetical protein